MIEIANILTEICRKEEKGPHFPINVSGAVPGKAMALGLIFSIFFGFSCVSAVSVDITPEIFPDPVIVPKGTALTLSGITKGTADHSGNIVDYQNYQLWILGRYYFEKRMIIPENGTWTFELGPGTTSELRSGQYFAVIQGDGFNAMFNAGEDISGEDSVADEGQAQGYPGNVVKLFEELDNPASDDPYARTTFLVEEPWLRYENILSTDDGEYVKIMAITNLPPGEDIEYILSYLRPDSMKEVVRDEARIEKGDNINVFTISIPKEDLEYGDYVLQSCWDNEFKSVDQTTVFPVDPENPPCGAGVEFEKLQESQFAEFKPEIKELDYAGSSGLLSDAVVVYDGYEEGARVTEKGIDGDRIYWVLEDRDELFVYNITSGKREEYDLGFGAMAPGLDLAVHEPAVSEDTAVYSVESYDPESGKREINLFILDLKTKEKVLLATNEYSPFGSDISGNTVVWAEIDCFHDFGNKIVLYDLFSGNKKTIKTFTIHEAVPDKVLTDGNYVVWRETAGGDGGYDSCFSYDIRNNEISEIALSRDDNSSISDLRNGILAGTYLIDGIKHRIDRELVRNGTPYGVYLYDLDKTEEFLIGGSDKTRKSGPQINGDYVVWSEMTDGHHEIYLYDLKTSKKTRLTYGIYDSYGVSTDGDYLVWCESETDISRNNPDELNRIFFTKMDDSFSEL